MPTYFQQNRFISFGDRFQQRSEGLPQTHTIGDRSRAVEARQPSGGQTMARHIGGGLKELNQLGESYLEYRGNKATKAAVDAAKRALPYGKHYEVVVFGAGTNSEHTIIYEGEAPPPLSGPPPVGRPPPLGQEYNPIPIIGQNQSGRRVRVVTYIDSREELRDAEVKEAYKPTPIAQENFIMLEPKDIIDPVDKLQPLQGRNKERFDKWDRVTRGGRDRIA